MGLFGLIASLFGAGCKPKDPAPTTAPPSSTQGLEVMGELRNKMLTAPASKWGIQPSTAYPNVFGVVMDMPVSKDRTATLVSMCDGNASLYTTSTFGVIGGIGHENVRTTSSNFVKEAQNFYATATPATDFPYPTSEHVRFYLLGYDGVRVIETQLRSLEKNSDTHSAMWEAGQRVLYELLLLTKNEKK